MRLLYALAAIGALGQSALAAPPDCKTIADPASRLTCYDKLDPPVATYPIPLPKPTYARPVSPAIIGDEGYAEPSGGEDAQMNERIHGICRGC
jgi:hypothetical protein